MFVTAPLLETCSPEAGPPPPGGGPCQIGKPDEGAFGIASCRRFSASGVEICAWAPLETMVAAAINELLMSVRLPITFASF
ncbi:hypothetical protein GCM10022398_16730 [Acetobacter lovaniensis]|jgi:hypothetical protein|nr:hypothetical protein AA0474_2556 [Acetobacter lovaniensis NRIC 0474]